MNEKRLGRVLDDLLEALPITRHSSFSLLKSYNPGPGCSKAD